MSLDADHIVDRRRMRRKLTFWRVVAVSVAALAVIGAGVFLTSGRIGLVDRPGGTIARVQIEGLIRSSRPRVEALNRLAESSARAVIVHVNSPGGTVAGSEQLHDSLIKLKAKKPMVVVIDGLAASGGYIAAMAADHIVAQQSSIVGSIGVIFQYPNVAELLKTVGVKIEEIKSSPLKGAPNGYEPTSPEARAAIESLVMDSYDWFKTMVRDRRKLDQAGLEKVADGRVFSGRQALELKLIDALGSEQAAIDWLAKTYPCSESSTSNCVDPKMPVRDFSLSPRLSDLPFLHVAMVRLFDAVGLTAIARRLEDWGTMQAIERLNLDGLLALWHPPVTN